MGTIENDWQDIEEVLGLFGKRLSAARRRYREYVEKGVALCKQPELTGGGLIRSAGGWKALKSISKSKIHIKGDERIIGDNDFVKAVLEEQNERLQRRYRLQAQGVDFGKILERVAEIFDLKPDQIIKAGKQRQLVKARRVACYWAVKELELPGTQVAMLFNICQPAVSRSVAEGGNIIAELNLKLNFP